MIKSVQSSLFVIITVKCNPACSFNLCIKKSLVAERSTLTRCTASVNQLADWTQTPADHRELPHLFTGLLVSLLLLSSPQRAPWQRAVQSRSGETNPQRLATPTLMKETPKNVISPISRLIKLCNRREFERIIWRGAVMCFFPLPSSLSPSLVAFLSGNCSESKYFFTTAAVLKHENKWFFIPEVVCSFVISGFSGAWRH